MDVITTSSTCTFTLRDEYPHLLNLENADVRDHIELATRYIYRLLQQGDTTAVQGCDAAARGLPYPLPHGEDGLEHTIRSNCCA